VYLGTLPPGGKEKKGREDKLCKKERYCKKIYATIPWREVSAPFKVKYNKKYE